MKILDEIYYGNIEPCKDPPIMNVRIAKVQSLISRNENELLSTLTEEGKVIYEKLANNQIERLDLTGRDMFSKGFRLGARIMLEVMSGNDDPHIDES